MNEIVRVAHIVGIGSNMSSTWTIETEVVYIRYTIYSLLWILCTERLIREIIMVGYTLWNVWTIHIWSVPFPIGRALMFQDRKSTWTTNLAIQWNTSLPLLLSNILRLSLAPPLYYRPTSVSSVFLSSLSLIVHLIEFEGLFDANLCSNLHSYAFLTLRSIWAWFDVAKWKCNEIGLI